MRSRTLPKLIFASLTSIGLTAGFWLLLATATISTALASKSTSYSNSLLKLAFNATPITGIADNAASSPLTNLYVSLHTADPTASGNQSSNEVGYTSYARVAVARTSSGWTVSTNSVVPAATINFPAGTGGSGTATYWAVGTASSGSGVLLYSGAISPSIVTGAGVTPSLTTSSTITEAMLFPRKSTPTDRPQALASKSPRLPRPRSFPMIASN